MKQRTNGASGVAEVEGTGDGPQVSRGGATAGTGRHDASRRVLRRPEVTARTGLGKSSLYAQMQAGTFPRSVNLGPRAVGWIESEIDAWIDDRIAAR